MGSLQDQPVLRERTFTMGSADLQVYRGQPARRAASVQVGESPAPTETTQGGQLASEPTGGQAAPAVVSQETGVQLVGQGTGEQLSTPQDTNSDGEMQLIVEVTVRDEMPESRDEEEPSADPQGTTEGHHLAHTPQEMESEMSDNEENSRVEAHMEASL